MLIPILDGSEVSSFGGDHIILEGPVLESLRTNSDKLIFLLSFELNGDNEIDPTIHLTDDGSNLEIIDSDLMFGVNTHSCQLVTLL